MNRESPRRQYPYELRVLVWRLAAKHGRKYQLILDKLYEVTREMEQEDTTKLEPIPEDTRTIRSIVDSIDDLSIEMIASEVPPEVWGLSTRYHDIKRIAETEKQETLNSEGEKEEISEDILKHDRMIFQQSDDILNEYKLDVLLDRLIIGNRYYLKEAEMVYKYIIYFKKESNKYIYVKLREHINTCVRVMRRLERFIAVHGEHICDDHVGMKFKLFPGGNSERFYDFLTNDKTRCIAERRMADKVDTLANECKVAYKEYRSYVRDTLFL